MKISTNGRIKLNTALRIAIACAGLAFGASASAAVTSSTTGRITSLVTLATGDFLISMDVDNTSCPSTENPKHYYLRAGQEAVTPEANTNIISAAMLGYSLGKKVTVWFDGATGYCFIGQLSVAD